MKRSLLAAFALSVLLSAPRAEAFAELVFSVYTEHPVERSIFLQCHANYAAPCTQGHGVNYSYTQNWNPLDGDRWSRYQLVMEGHLVYLDMYDTRNPCTVGTGWERGYLWLLYATREAGGTLGPFEICTARDVYGKENLYMHVRYDELQRNYDIDLRRKGPWEGPAVWLTYDPELHELTPIIVR